MEIPATGKAIFAWEEAAKRNETLVQLIAGGREKITRILMDLVSDDVVAGAVEIAATVHLLLVGNARTLDVTISGTPDEPIIEIELWPTMAPAVQAKIVEKPLNPGISAGIRTRTWTFSYPDKPAFQLTHRRVTDQYPDEAARAAFARGLAELAGWPFPAPPK